MNHARQLRMHRNTYLLYEHLMPAPAPIDDWPAKMYENHYCQPENIIRSQNYGLRPNDGGHQTPIRANLRDSSPKKEKVYNGKWRKREGIVCFGVGGMTGFGDEGFSSWGVFLSCFLSMLKCWVCFEAQGWVFVLCGAGVCGLILVIDVKRNYVKWIESNLVRLQCWNRIVVYCETKFCMNTFVIYDEYLVSCASIVIST